MVGASQMTTELQSFWGCSTKQSSNKKYAQRKDQYTAGWVEAPGTLKFNVDGVAWVDLGLTAFGGVLKDEVGMIKMMFSKAVRGNGANRVEILAIKKAFKLFGAS